MLLVTDNVYMELEESDDSNGELRHDLLNTKISEAPAISQSPDRNRGQPSVAPREGSPPIPPRRTARTVNSHLMPSQPFVETNTTSSSAHKEDNSNFKPPLPPPRKTVLTASSLSKSQRQIVVQGAPQDMNTYELLGCLKRRSIVSDKDIQDASYRPIERETLFLCQSKKGIISSHLVVVHRTGSVHNRIITFKHIKCYNANLLIILYNNNICRTHYL